MSRSPLRRLAGSVRSVRFRLAMLVTTALIVTAGVLVLGMNLALDTVVATSPVEQATSLEEELLRILGMSFAELDGSRRHRRDRHAPERGTGRPRPDPPDWFAPSRSRRSSCWCRSGSRSVGRSRAGSCGRSARSPASPGRSRRPISRVGSASAVPPDEMRDLADTFDAMLDRLDHGVQTQRRFVEDASHELRNPLAVIRTTLDVALSEPDDTEGLRRAAEVARRTADRMSATVDELLAFGRTSVQPERRVRRPRRDRGRGRPGVRRRGLDPWRPAVAARPVRSGRRRGPVRAEASPGEPRLERAPCRSPGSVVHCRAGRAGGWLWFGVRDVGRGIAPDEQALVFRRAWRDGAPTADGGGHGLGLALVRQICEAHGGTVSVASVPGHGASFVVWLPDRRGGAEAVPAIDLRAMADPLWTVDAAS